MSKLSSKRYGEHHAGSRLQRLIASGIRTGKLPAFVVLIAAVWLLISFLDSQRFHVKHVRVAGGAALTAEDVIALTGVTGRSIWFTQLNQIEARVGRSPYVERASVQLGLPDTVVVYVTERRPEVLWLHAGTSYAVSPEGLILSAVQRPQSQPAGEKTEGSGPQTAASGPAIGDGIVIVDTTEEHVLAPGDQVDHDALEVARRVMLRAAELPAPLQRIEWHADLGVSLIIDDKQIVLGTSERLDEKLAIMIQLIRDGTKFVYLDLRSTTPYYRVNNEQTRS